MSRYVAMVFALTVFSPGLSWADIGHGCNACSSQVELNACMLGEYASHAVELSSGRANKRKN